MSIEYSFYQCALSHGIDFEGEIIADGTLRRSHIKGQRSGTKNGAYVIYPDGKMPAGWGFDHKSQTEFVWRSGKASSLTTLKERAQLHAASIQREHLAKSKQAAAANRAVAIWNRALPADASHGYLARKKIQAHGVRVGHSLSTLADVLIVPLYSDDDELVSLQFIPTVGNKRFLKEGRKKACYWWIGKETSQLYIAEGFATAASIHAYTKMLTYVAFDAGNLEAVAMVVRKKYPCAEIIIAGDNDKHQVGQDAARKAALAVGGKYMIPPEVDTDWNDFLNASELTGGDQ